MKNISNQLGFSILIIFSTLYFFSGIFQLYPMSGWVDAGMYTGAKLNFAALAPDFKNVYQLNRLPYVLPGYFLNVLVNPFLGQKILVYSFYLTGIITLYFIAISLRKNHLIAFVSSAILAFNPYFIIALTSGGVGGVTIVYMLLATSFAFSSPGLNGNKNYLIASGFFAGMALFAHIFIIFYLFIVLVMYLYLMQKKASVIVKSRLIYITSGILVAFLILACIGTFFGLNFFFFKSNFGMAKNSLSGFGSLYSVPLIDWIFSATRLLFPISILLLSIKKYHDSKVHGTLSKCYKDAKLALIAIALPLFFMFFWDYFIGGTILQTQGYFVYLLVFSLFSFILFIPDIEIEKSILKAITNYSLFLFILSTPVLIIYKYPHLLDMLDDITNQQIVFILFSIMIYTVIKQKKIINKYIFVTLYSLLIITSFALDTHSRKVYVPYSGVDYKEAYKGSIKFIAFVESIRTKNTKIFICFDRNTSNEVNNKLSNNLQYGKEVKTITYFDTLASHYMWDKSIIDGKYFLFDQKKIKNKNDILIVFLTKNTNFEVLKKLIPYNLEIIGKDSFYNTDYGYFVLIAKPQ